MALKPSSIEVMRKMDRADARLLLSQAYFAAGNREYNKAMQIIDEWLGNDSPYRQHVATLKPGK